MNRTSGPEELADMLQRLRKGGTASVQDVELLAALINGSKISVSAARGVAVGSAQDSVIITGDGNEFQKIELTFNGPQAASIRMALGRAQLRNEDVHGLKSFTRNIRGDRAPLWPPGSILIFIISTPFSVIFGVIFAGITYYLVKQSPFASWLPVFIFLAVVVFTLVLNVLRVAKYFFLPARSFPCQVVEKSENGTVAFNFLLEDTEQSRYTVLSSLKTGERITAGDIGLATVKSNVLQAFRPFIL